MHRAIDHKLSFKGPGNEDIAAFWSNCTKHLTM